jgi:hypothetical protein
MDVSNGKAWMTVGNCKGMDCTTHDAHLWHGEEGAHDQKLMEVQNFIIFQIKNI